MNKDLKIRYLPTMKVIDDGISIETENVESIPIEWIEEQIESARKKVEYYIKRKGCESCVEYLVNAIRAYQIVIREYKTYQNMMEKIAFAESKKGNSNEK